MTGPRGGFEARKPDTEWQQDVLREQRGVDYNRGYTAGVASRKAQLAEKQAEIELWQEAMADAGRERIAVYEALVEAAESAGRLDFQNQLANDKLRAALAALDEDSTNCPSAHN